MITDSLSLITADLDNLEHCSAIIDLINEYRRDPMGGETGLITSDDQLILIDGLKSHPTSLIFLLKKDSAFAGAAICFTGYSTFKMKNLLNIHDFILFKKYRNRGYGTWFMKKIAEKISKLDYCRMTLEVRTDNVTAKKAYLNSGFSPCEHPMEFWVRNF
jgi:GNAT superfamily N-acetyltransferase